MHNEFVNLWNFFVLERWNGEKSWVKSNNYGRRFGDFSLALSNYFGADDDANEEWKLTHRYINK